MSFLQSTTTWILVGTFIIAGMSAIGVISPEIAATLIGLINAGGLKVHNSDIKVGKVGGI